MADWKDAFQAKTENTTPDIDTVVAWIYNPGTGNIEKVKPRNFLTLYALLASPTFTGTPAAPTASPGTNTTQLATTAYVIAEILARIASNDAMLYKGVIDCSANPNFPAADAGHTYKISVAGKIGGASGVTVEAGDMAICTVDSTASGTQAGVGANWDVIQTNLVGTYFAGGTDVAVADGGTGSSTASGARTNLGLVIGTDVQAHDSDLDTWAGITPGTNVGTNLAKAADGSVVDAIGFRGIPQNSQSAAYTTVMADAGKHLLHPAADTTARNFTIDSNANVAFPIGTAITFINQHGGGVITIKITSDTMRLAGAGTTGDRSLAADGIATAVKITSTEWIISGTGLT